jgi:hypothetical protein
VRILRSKHRGLRLGLSLAVAATAVLTLLVASPGLANLAGSTFEGNDGNLVVNNAGNTDWVNAPNRVRGDEQFSGTQDNAFGQGTKEDDPNVSVVTGSIPPNKSDLTRFYVASEFASNSNFLYLAWERSNVLGSANMDFEINQKAQPNLTTTGPKALVRTAGDILITFDFTNGGGNPVLGLLKWVTSGPTSQCFSANALPCWGNRVNLSAAGFAEGQVNAGTVTDPVAGVSLPGLTFGEAAVNLTAAGVFPAGTCEAFGSAFLKSRSSASFPAEVKDFVAPRPVNISNCGTIIVHKVTENGDASFGYTTTGGLSPATFNLSNGGTQTYGPGTVLPGNYSVAESTLPSGWTLKSLVCNTSGNGTSANPSGATVNITMAPGGIVDCTYTNHTNLSPTITTTLSDTTISIGGSVHDSAALTGATSDAGGTVTYTAYTDSACSLGAQAAGTVTVTNGVVPDSNAITFTSPGDFYWQAVYSGDLKNDGATSVCTSEHLVVKTNPSITTTLSATTVNIGDAVHDSAALTGATSDAGGTVTYTAYSDDKCSLGAQAAGTVTVTNGVVPDSNAITFTSPGDFYWQAVYSGDLKNDGATSVCTSEHLVVKTNPSITTTLSDTTISIGGSVHDSAALTGVTSDAGGTVTYTAYTDSACSQGAQAAGTVTVTGGVVPDSNAITFTSAGDFYWQAVYSGDAKNNGATSVCTSEHLVVTKNQPGIGTALNLLPNDDATLSGLTSNAGGKVTFSLFSPSEGTCSGTAAYTQTVDVSGNGTYSTTNTTFLAKDEGTWRWLVTYSGDANNQGATSACGVEHFTITNS